MPDVTHKPPSDAQHGAPQASRPRKSEKPVFEDFMHRLRGIVDGATAKDVLAQILLLLRKGFADELKDDHVDTVLGALAPYASLDRLAVRLVTDGRQRGAQLIVALRNRLRDSFAKEIGFPSPQSHPGETDRLFHVATWIKQGDRNRKTADAPQCPDWWLRKAFVCVAGEPDVAVRVAAVSRLLQSAARRSMRHKAKALSTDAQGYLRQAGSLLSVKKISPQRVAAALQFGHPCQEQRQQDQLVMAELRQQAGNATSKWQALEQRVARLDEELLKLRTTEQQLKQRLNETEAQLRLERNRLTELREHWERESQQRLARLRHSICSSMAHSLQEARLALDREQPNVAMALSRVRQMEQDLRKVEQPS